MSINIKTNKILSEENIRKIIMLGISLKDIATNIQDKCLEEYNPDKNYLKDSYFTHNGYLYKAKTVITGEFNENKVEKIGDELSLIDLQTIKNMINLSDEEIANLQSLILDSSIELSHVWSSSKTYTEIQNAIKKGEEFTLSKLASTMTASFEIASSTSDMTANNILYLLNTGTNTYDIYALISGTPTKIASTTIDLSQYAKLTDLDNYLKKTDADGKYATITTVDGKVDKTSILSTISSTPSDDNLLSEKAIDDTFVKKTDITTTIDSTSTDTQVPSSKAVKTELDKKVDKSSIVTTTINSSSTDAQVPSAKSIYYNCIEGIVINQTTIDTYGAEILKYPLGIWRISGNNLASQFTDLPVKVSGRIEITSIEADTNINPWNREWSYRVYNFEPYKGENYIRKIASGNTIGVITNDSGWKKVCTTSELTELSLANNWNKTKARVVKNGNVVNIEISATDGTKTSGTTIATLPEGFRPTSSPILIGTTEEGYGKNMKVQYFCIQPDGQVIIFAQEALRQIKLSASFILD